MIQNELQLVTSQRWLRTLRDELEKMRQEYSDPQEFAVFTQGVREQIDQLELEIKEYAHEMVGACPKGVTSTRQRKSLTVQRGLYPRQTGVQPL